MSFLEGKSLVPHLVPTNLRGCAIEAVKAVPRGVISGMIGAYIFGKAALPSVIASATGAATSAVAMGVTLTCFSRRA